MVEKSTRYGGGTAQWATPRSENRVVSVAAASARHSSTASAPSAACAGLAAATAPALARAALLAGVRFHTRTSKFARSRRPIMGAPMSPAPKNASVLMLLFATDCVVRARCDASHGPRIGPLHMEFRSVRWRRSARRRPATRRAPVPANAATAMCRLSTSKKSRSAARVSLRPKPSVPSTTYPPRTCGAISSA